MAKRPVVAQLVVEGKDDQHVIWALCKSYAVPEIFSIETPGSEEGGINELLASIPVRLKIAGIQSLGIVVDADQNIRSRWHSVLHRLTVSGYTNLPEQPDPNGTIILQDFRPRVGIWLMPDNSLPGMLEDFVALLIPKDDLLFPKAVDILQEIENEGINKYIVTHRSKALIHTWLAWQGPPGRPMGQAITSTILQPNSTVATSFVDWLNRLFS